MKNSKKKWIANLVACAMVFSVVSCETKTNVSDVTQTEGETVKSKDDVQDDSLLFKPGKYKGEAKGFGLHVISVEVSVDDKEIKDIVLTAEDIDALSEEAISKLTKEVLDKQSVDVDAVSGATNTSRGFKRAVRNALKQGVLDESILYENNVLEYKPGTYEGQAKGNNGPVNLVVDFSKDKIEKIVVGENDETPNISKVAFESLPEKIVKYQTLDIDVVSGATSTSAAIFNAVVEAANAAGAKGDILFDQPGEPDPDKKDETFDYDIVVVGGGLAGLMAATTAAREGLSVALIEKQAFLGGTTILASGNMRYANAGDEAELVEAILKEGKPFRKDGDKYPIIDKLNKLSEVSPLASSLIEESGISFMDLDKRPFVHKPRPEDPEGTEKTKTSYLYVNHLSQYFEKLGGTIYLETPGTSLIKDDSDNRVVGVISDSKYGKKTFNAKVVVLTSGEYANNQKLIKEFSPESVGNFTGSASGNTGDGILLATEVGAQVYDNQFSMGGAFMFDPYNSHRGGMLGSEYLKESLMVSIDGERKISESVSPKFVHSVYINPDRADSAWSIMDSDLVKKLERTPEEMMKQNDKIRMTYKADTIEDLASQMGVDPAAFKKTVDRYNEMCDKKEDTDFEKDVEYLVPVKTAPFYASMAYCITRGMAGGIVTNLDGQVVDENDEPILGLYAGGSISSRPFYGRAYQGAAALAVAANMGYLAGLNAANAAKALKK